MNQHTADTAADASAVNDRARRKRERKELKRKRKESKRKRKKLKLRADEIAKSSSEVTTSHVESNELATKINGESKKKNRGTSRASASSISGDKEKQPGKEVVAQAGSSSITATKRKSWDESLMQLQLYKVEHGDCLVPRGYKDKQLAAWVKNQRAEYKKHKKGLPSKTTEERIAALEAVNFVWDAQEFAWKCNLMDLIAYRELHGNCFVPYIFPIKPILGEWVQKQRKEYEKFQKQQPSQITQARIERLEAEGFTWKVKVAWDHRYYELLQYRKTHGNCKVPLSFTVNPQLGEWVHTQRKEHQKLKNGKKSQITTERVQKLNEIEFVWMCRAVRN